MKGWGKAVVTIAAIAFITALAVIVGAPLLKHKADVYKTELQNCLNAAMIMGTQEGAEASPETGVVARWQGEERLLNPENYRKVSYYLRNNAVWTPLASGGEARLDLTVCGETRISLWPLDDGEAVGVEMLSGGKTYRMRVCGHEIWKSILHYAVEGSQSAPNEAL